MTTPPPAPPRSWRRALSLAALTLWLPALLPYWIGPLQECEHCMQTYARCLPLVPGILLPALMQLNGVWFVVVGSSLTLALFGAVTAVLRLAPRLVGSLLQTAVILLVGFEALGFSFALRA